MARPGLGWAGGGSSVQRGASLSSQEGYFPLQVFLGKTRELRRGAGGSATRAPRGKTQPGFRRSAFLLLFIGKRFALPLPGWGGTPGGLRGAGTGLACAFPGSLSQGPELFFQVLFQDTLISSVPALAAWGFFCCRCRCYGWLFAAPCGCTLLMTWQKTATG